MPLLILIIIIMMVAMSSGNEETTQAQNNSFQGAENHDGARQEFEKRIEDCGSRCEDVYRDYSTKIEKE